MRDGAAPDFDSLGLLLSLRTRWYALRREHASELDADWVRALAQQASGKVLSHADASQGLKAMATRAVSAWTPQDEEARSRVSPSDSSGPPPKRIKLASESTDGERVQWTDEDDLL